MNEELNIFLKEIEHCSYGQKYIHWSQYLQKQCQADNYPYLLGYFLEYFPFNYRYWLEYIHLTKLEEYQTALLRNPKSYQLWIGYLNNYKLTHEGEDPLKYKRQLERAILQIGADSRSLFLYEEYYDMVNESVRFEFYKKVFTRALIGLQGLYDKFKGWFSSLTDQNITTLAIKQLKNAATALNLEEQRAHLNNMIGNIYKKTLSYRDKRLRLQEQIKHNYFEGEYSNEQKKVWHDLIALERSNGIVQNISYCYERSLMAQTDDVELWQQVFHYMENETNKYTKVLSILRNNRQFFLKFDLNIYFYWCDLEERENVGTARKMYQQQAKINNIYEVYQRWIQLQIRQKQWNSAKLMYDTLITLYKDDIHLLTYILVEYSQFVVKYYKDFEYAKKLLKTYFDALPFNQYLFNKYLQFFKNFENKQGYYDQLMMFINEALGKAKSSLSQQEFTVMTRALKYYLRSTLSSIYLIKLSERKMIEYEEKLGKNI